MWVESRSSVMGQLCPEYGPAATCTCRQATMVYLEMDKYVCKICIFIKSQATGQPSPKYCLVTTCRKTRMVYIEMDQYVCKTCIFIKGQATGQPSPQYNLVTTCRQASTICLGLDGCYRRECSNNGHAIHSVQHLRA